MISEEKEKMDVNVMIKGFNVRKDEEEEERKKRPTVESTIKETRKFSLSLFSMRFIAKSIAVYFCINDENY
jgi:hypothetical protein